MIGYIYIITFNNNDNSIYIGSTKNLEQRIINHKLNPNCNMFRYMRDIYDSDWSICNIEIYDEFECENKEELRLIEGEIQKQFLNEKKYILINGRIEGRKNKEWIEENKEKLKEQHKIYRNQNKDYFINYRKNYYELNKDKIIQQSKNYYIENKEKKIDYYNKNKDKLNEKINCECGGKYTFKHQLQHLKTKKHLKFTSLE